MRQEHLNKARLVAHRINFNQFRSLTGTPADLDKPEYLRLKQQLGNFVAVSGNIRFIYLTGQRDDGKVFFYVDNEPVGSENESSPAGAPYSQKKPWFPPP